MDVVWAIYWSATWDDQVIDTTDSQTAHTFVLTLTVIQIIVKTVVIGLCIYSDRLIKQAATTDGVLSHGKQFIGLEKDDTKHQEFKDTY